MAPPKEGLPPKDDSHRCMYVIFGYQSNLSNDENWLGKEYSRLLSAATSSHVRLECVDRLIILDRGIIHPSAATGKWDANSDATIFLEGIFTSSIS